MTSMRTNILQVTLVFVVLIFTNPVYAKSIDLNLNSDALRFTYAFMADRKLVTDLGLLYLDKKQRFDDDELAFHAGLNVVSGNIRLGGRAFFVSPGNAEVLAVGLGGQGRFALSSRVGLGGHFYYAPQITSMLDAKGYHDFSLRLDFKVAPSGYLYLGYRNIKVRIGDRQNKVELDDGAMLGFKVYF
jgi:hypothetical protein